MPDLLFELGTEEIPATYVPPAIEQLRRAAEARLAAAGLAATSIRATATPRRLVLFVEGLPEAQPARVEEIQGPPEKAAFKAGDPTPAAKGFAEKNGLRIEDLVIKDTPRGRYVFGIRRVEGRRTADLLAEMLPEVVRGLAWPKSMKWPQAPGVAFTRPVRRVMALLGEEALAVEVAGVRAGATTVGHPILAPREIPIARADRGEYAAALRAHSVLVDRDERRAAIERGLAEIFSKHEAVMGHPELLDEVTDLVEWPGVASGGFDPKYLDLPPEVVEAAMTDHQRYFPIVREGGKIEPRFAFVANCPASDLIREGNERVLRARLEDAEFYLREDRKRPLGERVEALDGIVFQEKLGTMLRKTERLERLAAVIAGTLGYADAERAAATRAARLAKTDLTTELVKEFPELQGAIGAKYAAMQGEPAEVADAIREQYLPRFAGDELPRTRAGIALSLADKLDNLCGFYSVDLAPSGSADPYGLRRQMIGVARIILERSLRTSLGGLIDEAAKPHSSGASRTWLDVLKASFQERAARQMLLDQGYRYDLVDAAMAAGADDLVDLKARLDAIAALSNDGSWPDLVELVERTFNISKSLKAEEAREPRSDLCREPAETELFAVWESARGPVAEAIDRRDYAAAAKLYLDALGAPVHTFMEKVFVNVEDADVRLNRLSLLRGINRAFAARVADLAKVVEGKK